MNTFVELYQREKAKPTPAQQFYLTVHELTGISYDGMMRWVRGEVRPNKAAMNILSQAFGVPADELFPPKRLEGSED